MATPLSTATKTDIAQALPTESGLSPAVIAVLIFTPLLIAVGQVLFKISSTHMVESGATSIVGQFWALAFDPVFIASLVLYGVGTLFWVGVMRHVPLSMAYSFMVLTFVFVPVLAKVFLHETLDLRYFAGTAMIIAGVLFINV